MPKKKIKEKRIHFLLDKIRYDKLLKCAGEYNTLTDILNKSIDGYYYSVFKTNDVIDTSIPSNREVVKQLQKESVNKTNLEDARAAFIARRNAKKEDNSNIDEDAEFELLKANAIAKRNAKREGDSNA